ncbi:hypothetical protein Cs7R123_11840 [Catellatospora sp. TT07R-123]|nr:hypothetical protein Cs7R123_11840 [Catellatospora sp. TT07R-123]
MRDLSPADLDRLVKSGRRLKLSALFVVLLMFVLVGVLVAVGIDFRCGAGLGVLIGLLLLIPHRNLLAELGLTNAEAKEILAAERKRRRAAAQGR